MKTETTLERPHIKTPAAVRPRQTFFQKYEGMILGRRRSADRHRDLGGLVVVPEDLASVFQRAFGDCEGFLDVVDRRQSASRILRSAVRTSRSDSASRSSAEWPLASLSVGIGAFA
jgi:hypothetical protein